MKFGRTFSHPFTKPPDKYISESSHADERKGREETRAGSNCIFRPFVVDTEDNGGGDADVITGGGSVHRLVLGGRQ